MKKTKINTVNRTLALAALVALIATPVLRADDSNSGDNSKSGDNSTQSSDNSGKSSSSSDNSQSSDNSKSSDNGNSQSGDNSKASPQAVTVNQGTPEKFQSQASPYGLQTAGKVMQAGSTADSKNFDTTVMPSLLDFIKKSLPETINNTKSSAFEIDPSKLVLKSDYNVTATFVYENAGYHNSFGVDTVAAGKKGPSSALDEVTSDTAKLLFPDTSTPAGGAAAIGTGATTQDQPVVPGDFVNLGNVKAGTALDFFLIANGANGGNQVFSANEALNKDGFSQHVAGFTTHLFAVPQLNSPYIFLSFEDLWGGGDKDINDTIVAINVGAATVNALLATPEPAMPLTFAACLGLALIAVRKNKKATTTV